MRDTIDMAREAGLEEMWEFTTGFTKRLKAFEALVRADERGQGQKWFDAVTAQHKADIDRAFSAGLAEGEKLAIEAAAPVQQSRSDVEPVATLDDLEQEIYENTRQFVSSDVMEWMLKRYYTTPPQRTWVGLTQQDIDIAFDDTQEGGGFDDFSRAIEAKLKEKNT